MHEHSRTLVTHTPLISNKNGSGFLAAFDSGMSFLPFDFYLNSSDVQSLLQTFDAVPVQQGTLQPLQHRIQRQWIQSRVVPHVQTIVHNAGQLPPLSANLTYFTAFGGTLVCTRLACVWSLF